MKKIISVVFALSALFALLSAATFARDSGYEIPYSDDIDWDRFRGQNISINVYNWGEYISVADGDECTFDTNAEFEKLTGIKVVYTNFASNEEMYAKLRAGGTSYDIVIPSDYMISRMINEGMLEKIDFSNVENFRYIRDDMKNPAYDPTGEYSVPYTWGLVGIIYNTEMVSPDDDVETWDILWDVNYANNVFMFSNSRDTFGIALKRLGYSFNTENEDEIREAAESLAEQKPIVQAYVMDEIFDKMGGGEAALAPYYAGDAITMMEDNPSLAFAVPREGTNVFYDAMCIPKGAKNKEAAELYINFMCETLTALKNIEYIKYSTPHTEAFEYLDEETKNSISYPPDEVVENGEVFFALSDSTTKLYDTLWTDIMSTGNTNPATVPIFLGVCIAAAVVINVWKYRKKKAKKL